MSRYSARRSLGHDALRGRRRSAAAEAPTWTAPAGRCSYRGRVERGRRLLLELVGRWTEETRARTQSVVGCPVLSEGGSGAGASLTWEIRTSPPWPGTCCTCRDRRDVDAEPPEHTQRPRGFPATRWRVCFSAGKVLRNSASRCSGGEAHRLQLTGTAPGAARLGTGAISPSVVECTPLGGPILMRTLLRNRPRHCLQSGLPRSAASLHAVATSPEMAYTTCSPSRQSTNRSTSRCPSSSPSVSMQAR